MLVDRLGVGKYSFLANRLLQRVVECPRASGTQVGIFVVKHTRNKKVIWKAKGARRLQRTQVIEEAVLKLVNRAQTLGVGHFGRLRRVVGPSGYREIVTERRQKAYLLLRCK
jgi:hypothetical protein